MSNFPFELKRSRGCVSTSHVSFIIHSLLIVQQLYMANWGRVWKLWTAVRANYEISWQLILRLGTKVAATNPASTRIRSWRAVLGDGTVIIWRKFPGAFRRHLHLWNPKVEVPQHPQQTIGIVRMKRLDFKQLVNGFISQPTREQIACHRWNRRNSIQFVCWVTSVSINPRPTKGERRVMSSHNSITSQHHILQSWKAREERVVVFRLLSGLRERPCGHS